jgi:FAD:protein FMN transferase
VSHDEALAVRAVEAAFEAVRCVDRLMHPTRADSDLARIAACAAGGITRVHGWTFEVLELCRTLNTRSKGIFDPCPPGSGGAWHDVELHGQGEVRLRAPLRLDLGGIAKGYAVDRAIEALRDAGCSGGLVNAGGDLAVFGPDPRRILRRGPGGLSVELRDAALATSVVAAPSRPREHLGHYHGLSGASAASGSVSVIAARAAVADALTKCLIWCDTACGDELLASFGARRLAA